MNDVTRLPKWAQEHIASVERDRDRVEALLDEAQSTDTNVWLGSFNSRTPLPEGSTITFDMGDGQQIMVRHAISENTLYVMARDGALIMRPSGGCNTMHLRVEDL